MTRKELAESIFDMQVKRGIIIGKNGKANFVNNALKGCGASKPMSKQELTDLYNRLVDEA